MTSPPSTDSLCLFELGGQRFGLGLQTVKEIVPMAALSRPPSLPAILEGFLNLRGTVVPVVQLATLLGLPPDPLELHTALVILRRGELTLAFVVRAVIGIGVVSKGDVLPIGAADCFNGCVTGSVVSAGNGNVLHLLSPDRLFLAKEERTFAEYQAIERHRLQQAGHRVS